MALLSCWGEVTTENEQEVIAANRMIHPQVEELLSVLSDILNSAKIEYWIDQGTLLGAYRHGKFIARDSDADIAIRNEDHFEALPELLESKLPSAYGWEIKEDHCRGCRIWLKTGGTFKGTFEEREIQWPLVCCDAMFYQYNEHDKTYVQQYQGFGVETFFIPETVIFPLGQIEFEESMYPCPTRVEEYLEIQYGYIGEDAYWDPEINRWIKG
ncbi:MAG: LicD family protein [Gammaproteobacteria bacterium]|nr:LicD family protein [Gammaproteobacteria bacterium]MCK5499489.1 LicD family protein [Gammaproteobacteria bacterium]